MRQKQNNPEHPYTKFENTPLWKVIKKAVKDLEKNQDLNLTARPEYIIGYICKQLKRRELVNSESLVKQTNE